MTVAAWLISVVVPDSLERRCADRWTPAGPVVPGATFYGILPTVDSAVRRTRGQQRPVTAESGK
jgi:hypothetical protein